LLKNTSRYFFHNELKFMKKKFKWKTSFSFYIYKKNEKQCTKE